MVFFLFFQLAVSPSSIGAAWRRLYLQLRAGWTFLPLRAVLQKLHGTSQSWLDSVHARTHACKGFKVHQEKNDRSDLSRVCASKTLRKSTWYRIQTGANKGERGDNQRIRLVCCLGRKNMSKPDYSGTYHMVEQTNMDAYLEGLGEAGVALNYFLNQL